MPRTPRNQSVAILWAERRALLERVQRYNDAIAALQRLCDHKNQEDVSRHGSPDMECPDCGKGMLP